VTATPYALDPLRDVRHRDARSARDIADWLAWLELGGKAPRTLDAYERTAAALLNAFPTHAFAEFTDGDLMHLLLTFPAGSRRIRKAHLASLFDWGFTHDRIPADPVRKLPKISATKQQPHDVFADDEVAALCALPSPDGHLMCLLFEAGLRLQEATHMTVRRIDFEQNLVVVREGAKGSRSRVVPMVPQLASAMASMVLVEGLNPGDYLWYDRPGSTFAKKVRRSKPIADNSFRDQWWRKSLERAGVRYRNPHTARHTFATRWSNRGLSMHDIQKLLGHASISTTADVYVHLGVNEIGDRMAAILSGDGR
jgi:integrase